MNDDRRRLDRASFAALRARPDLCSDDLIRAAVARADHDDAAIRALARAHAGADLPIELIAELLPGLDLPEVFVALLGHASGDRVAALSRLIDARAFGVASAEPVIATLVALWRLEPSDEMRDRVRRTLRRIFDCQQSPRSLGQATWLAAQIDDEAVFERLDGWEPLRAAEARAWAAAAERMLEPVAIDALVATLPEHDPDVLLPGVPVRAAAKPGRNEPCPCGSGQKYKKCCADKPVAAEAPVATSRAAQVAEISHRLQREDLAALAPVDRAAIDLARLEPTTLIALMRLYAVKHDWARAAAAVEALVQRGVGGHPDGWRDELVNAAISGGNLQLAREQLDRYEDPAAGENDRLTLALAAGAPDALDLLRRRAAVAVRDESGLDALELAHALLPVEPELGILLARGALRADRALDGEALMDTVEDARDQLLLPPGDPGWDLFDALGGAGEGAEASHAGQEERARLARATEELSASLAQTTARLAELERQRADEEAQRRRAERTAPDPGRRATIADDPERRILRDKVAELEARIREGNEERASLRRRVAEVATTTPRPAAARAEPRDAGDGDAEEDAQLEATAIPDTRAVLVPRFTSRAQAAVETQRRQASAEAMRTVGSLCAGDPAAWRGAKQAKDMPRQVLMCRIGIHHRLLFRIDGGTLEVLDLVTRESLMTTLKRLRAG